MFDMRKYASYSGKMLNSNERGVILIWLIFILVAAGILGSSMVYLTTSSTYDELLANNQARAYYTAEAGGRYVIPRMLLGDTADFVDSNGDPLPDPVRFTLLSNGGIFEISEMKITPEPGKLMTVISTGIVNEGSWLEGSRRITYGLVRTFFNFLTPDQLSFEDIFDICSGDDFADIYCGEKADNECAIRMKDLGQDFEMSIGLDWFEKTGLPQLHEVREKNDDFLSYQLQVKFKLDPTGVAMGNHFMAGLSFRLGAVAGSSCGKTDSSSYGISFFKSDSTHKPPPPDPPTMTDVTWFDDFSSGNIKLSDLSNGEIYLVLWKQVPPIDNDLDGFFDEDPIDGTDNDGDGEIDEDPTERTVLDYRLLGENLKDWSTIAVKILESKEVGESRKNEIFVHVKEHPDYPRNKIRWDFDWNNPVLYFEDKTNPLTSINFETPPPPPYPYEVGIHAFYDGQANNDLFFDDFSLVVFGKGIKPIQY